MNFLEEYGLKSVIGYKWIREDMCSVYGNEPPWEINKWKKIDDRVDMCQYGYHSCRTPIDSSHWIIGTRWFVIEARFIKDEYGGKFVCKKMRLIKELPAREIFTDLITSAGKIDDFLYLISRDSGEETSIERYIERFGLGSFLVTAGRYIRNTIPENLVDQRLSKFKE